MLLDFEHQPASVFAPVDLQRAVDLGQVLTFEGDVDHRTDDLVDSPDAAFLGLHVFFPGFLLDDCHLSSS